MILNLIKLNVLLKISDTGQRTTIFCDVDGNQMNGLEYSYVLTLCQLGSQELKLDLNVSPGDLGYNYCRFISNICYSQHISFQ